jgi:hypothetical protein
MPFIELELKRGYSQRANCCATVRKQEVLIYANIYYTAQDNVEAAQYGKKISDEICNQIRTNQCVIPTTHFVNVENTGRVITETFGRQVVYRKRMEIYALCYDTP